MVIKHTHTIQRAIPHYEENIRVWDSAKFPDGQHLPILSSFGSTWAFSFPNQLQLGSYPCTGHLKNGLCPCLSWLLNPTITLKPPLGHLPFHWCALEFWPRLWSLWTTDCTVVTLNPPGVIRPDPSRVSACYAPNKDTNDLKEICIFTFIGIKWKC